MPTDKSRVHFHVFTAEGNWTGEGPNEEAGFVPGVTVETYWNTTESKWYHKINYKGEERFFASDEFILFDLQQIINWIHMIRSLGLPIIAPDNDEE